MVILPRNNWKCIIMEKSKNLPSERLDSRPEHFLRIGNELRRNRNIWYDLNQIDMTDLLIFPGDKEVLGEHEVEALRSGFETHLKKLRDGCYFEVRIIGRQQQHQARYTGAPETDGPF